MPAAIRSSIILTHWGRKDANHSCNTGYGLDCYSKELVHPQYEPDGYLRKLAGWPCHDPVKVGVWGRGCRAGRVTICSCIAMGKARPTCSFIPLLPCPCCRRRAGPCGTSHEDTRSLPCISPHRGAHPQPHLAGLSPRAGKPAAAALAFKLPSRSNICMLSPSRFAVCMCPQVQLKNPAYSRGIRQRLATASKEHGWLEKHKIVVGE